MSVNQVLRVGSFFSLKARVNADERGTYQAARNLRKQGVPLSLALLILVGR